MYGADYFAQNPRAIFGTYVGQCHISIMQPVIQDPITAVRVTQMRMWGMPLSVVVTEACARSQASQTLSACARGSRSTLSSPYVVTILYLETLF